MPVLRFLLAALIVSMAAAGCSTLFPSNETQVEIENYGSTALTVTVRASAKETGQILATANVGEAIGENWQGGKLSFERPTSWSVWVNGHIEFTSDRYDASGPEVLIVRQDRTNELTVEQQVRL